MTTDVAPIQPFEGPGAAEEAEIRRAIDDYYGAWFDADPERMARVLHPQLAKRGWLIDRTGARVLDPDTFESMVDWTRKGSGRTDDPAARHVEVRVIEAYDDIATALVHTPRDIETLQLIRTAEGWRILNVLWRSP